MRSEVPLISVGIPVYNGEKYIEKSINSILEQTFEDFELIISDNASSDGTEELCRSLEKKDDRIIYHRNSQNIGAGRNYNILFHKSRGKYFRWQNADDYADPELHRLCLEKLQQNPDAVLSYGKTKIVDSDDNFLRDYDDNLNLQEELPSERFKHFMKVRGWTNIIYGLMTRDAMAHTALFGNFQAADYNFIGEICLYGKFCEISQPLFYRRIHPDANTWNPKDKKVQQEFWDPSDKAFKNQVFKQYYNYFKGELKSPISIAEKVKISKFLLKKFYWRKNDIWRDFISSEKK